MKSPIAKIVFAFTVIVILGVDSAVAQPTATKRNFDAEIQAALESAKTAAWISASKFLFVDVGWVSTRQGTTEL